ncbi:MAG: hypothetical protein BWK80_45330 [Desulfobacteraceae bacterium IS3]|nr:MAG: hypothetical protein BWK80_45330 [Desulfobacteraceae bacterium IS3]
MKKILAVFIFFIFTGFPALSEAGKADIKFKGEMLSADIQNAPLKEVTEKIGKEKGIWFKGEESLFEEKVSVRFTDIPLEQGLKRILGNLNHSIVFDKNSNVQGILIVGTSAGKGGKPVAMYQPAAPPEIHPGISPEPISEPKMFRSRRNMPPPGGPVETNPADLEAFQSMKNAPPPPPPADMPPGMPPEMDAMMKNVPMPGNNEE